MLVLAKQPHQVLPTSPLGDAGGWGGGVMRLDTCPQWKKEHT